ncbi:MAG: efflux transporter outer membrane subunit [Gammaproteobacteria bacterium]
MNTVHRSAPSAARRGIIRRAALAFAVVTGCAVGPDYRAPELAVPARYSESGVHASAGTSLAEWWRVFRDAPLERLVARAIDANLDLRIAESRVREARALRGVVRSALWPTVDGGAAYSRTRQSENGSLGGAVRRGLVPLETDLYEAALDASWEIDIFGGTRRAVESGEAEIGAADEARRDILVSLLGEVGSTYIELRGLQQELAVTQANIKAQEQTLALTRDRVQAGLATELDVTRAQAQVATTRAEVPSLTSALKRAVHRLSVLVGVSPGELAGPWLQARPVPAGPPEVPAGMPSDLLRRRPDIRRAERELHAATARIGVATADLFPRFSLTGAVGLQSVAASDFFTGGSRFFALGPAIHWPIFNAGRIRDNIEVQDLRQEQALLAYRQTVLLGLEEVENALVTHREARLRFQELREAEGAERRAVALAHDRYRSGLVDFLDVLEAERTLYAAQSELARGERAVGQDLVRLYKALGGGWGHDVARAQAMQSPWPISSEG